MTAYRFRVKLEWDPTALWRDIIVGEDRTLDEFKLSCLVLLSIEAAFSHSLRKIPSS
jgi:hypothetical protein